MEWQKDCRAAKIDGGGLPGLDEIPETKSAILKLREFIAGEKFAFWFSAAIMFSLISLSGMPLIGHALKFSDIFLALAGISTVASVTLSGRFPGELLRHFRPYLWFFTLLIFFIAVAQISGYISGEGVTAKFNAIENYPKAIFNACVFFLMAFIAASYKKVILPISIAIVVSPAVIMPVWRNMSEGVFIGGGRLMGFLSNAIYFGFWMSIAFLVGIGLMSFLKKRWQKLLAFCWLVVIASFILWAASRASWVAIAVASILSILFYMYKRDFRRAGMFAAVIVLSFSLGYFLLPNRELRIQDFIKVRTKNLLASVATLDPQKVAAQRQTTVWPKWIAFVAANPVGHGFDNDFAAKQVSSMLDNPAIITVSNSFLQTALFGGIGALAAFLAIFLFLGRDIWRSMRMGSSERISDLKLMWLLSGPALAIDIFFTDAFFWRHVWVVLGIVLGISLAKDDGLLDPAVR